MTTIPATVTISKKPLKVPNVKIYRKPVIAPITASITFAPVLPVLEKQVSEVPTDYPKITFENPAKWRDFLEENHDKIPGIWMKLAKKASGIPSVTYPEALDEALCYGWIDGQRLSFDDKYYLQRFTPRSKKSNWSTINIAKVAKLIEENRMTPSGLAAIEIGKKNGYFT